jgi:transaldolase
LPAIRALLSEGIKINITLLFSLTRYREVAEAFLAGLEDRLAARGAIERVASVASFFLSRIDLVVDSKLEAIGRRGPELENRARALRGKAAIACAKQAYQIYKEIVSGDRFRRLAAAGARPQRVLWASTSTKRPEERDVRYVEALIGPDTINTMPLKTLEAFRDHGDPAPRLEQELDKVRATLRELGEIGVDLEAVSRQLEAEGVRKFVEPFDHLHEQLRRKVALAEPGVARDRD